MPMSPSISFIQLPYGTTHDQPGVLYFYLFILRKQLTPLQLAARKAIDFLVTTTVSVEEIYQWILMTSFIVTTQDDSSVWASSVYKARGHFQGLTKVSFA
jgi:hypothetical protein